VEEVMVMHEEVGGEEVVVGLVLADIRFSQRHIYNLEKRKKSPQCLHRQIIGKLPSFIHHSSSPTLKITIPFHHAYVHSPFSNFTPPL
jgi:hypothetical protein